MNELEYLFAHFILELASMQDLVLYCHLSMFSIVVIGVDLP